MEGLTIRKATDADQAVIFDLYQVLEAAYDGPGLDAAERQSLWERVSRDDRQHLLVAQIDGQVVGTLALVVIPNLGHHGQPSATVMNVAVSEAARGKGIGTALLAEAGRIAREQNCYKIVLSSNLVRHEAHEFYRRLGWRQTHIGFSLEL